MGKLSKYVSPNGEYIIPVSWEVYSTVVITGVNNLEEALKVAEDYLDEIPLADNAEYVDGSYTIDDAGDEDWLIYAQDYHTRGTYFHNPRAKD